MVRVLARRVPFPQSDLDALDNLNDKNAYEREFNETIAYLTARDSNGNGHIVLCDTSGRIVNTGSASSTPNPVTLYDNTGALITPTNGVPTVFAQASFSNLIAPRTDTSTFLSNALLTPGNQQIVFLINITAISGTSPTVQFKILYGDSQGNFPSSAISQTGLISTVTATTVGHAIPSKVVQYKLQAVITGTLPSVSWYCDIFSR